MQYRRRCSATGPDRFDCGRTDRAADLCAARGELTDIANTARPSTPRRLSSGLCVAGKRKRDLRASFAPRFCAPPGLAPLELAFRLRRMLPARPLGQRQARSQTPEVRQEYL